MKVAPAMTAIITLADAPGAIDGSGMLLRFSVLALAALAVSACNRPAGPVPVFIDERYTREVFADRVCPPVYQPPTDSSATPPPTPEPACARKWQLVGQDFEQTQTAQFAALPTCSGVSVATYNPTEMLRLGQHERLGKIMDNPYWHLAVYFDPRAQKQAWDLTLNRQQPPFSGEGDARLIATEVCNIVLRRGGAVGN